MLDAMSLPLDGFVKIHKVDSHQIDLEWPDVVHIHYDGEVELSHFLAFNDVMLNLPPPTRLYLLRDARRGGLISPETRKLIATRQDDSRLIAIASYGSSFQSKTVFANVSRAIRAIRTAVAPIEFFDTETEARAWIAELQKQMAST